MRAWLAEVGQPVVPLDPWSLPAAGYALLPEWMHDWNDRQHERLERARKQAEEDAKTKRQG